MKGTLWRPIRAVWILVWLSLLLMSAAQAALQARLSQDTVYLGDTLTLTLSSDSGGNSGRPDLSPLQQDFEIAGTGTSSQFSMINGRTSSRTEWQIRLIPRRSGELTIPALQASGDRSAPLTVKVSDQPPPVSAATAQSLFVEATVDPSVTSPYVQQQVPYTVRFFFDETVREGALTEPQVADAVVERIGEDRRYTATRNGRQYRVTERRYAIFPQKSGELEIPPVRFEGRVATGGNQQGGGPRDGSFVQRFMQNSPFANDPFFQGRAIGKDPFGGVFSDPGRAVRVAGPALRLTIRPRAGTQTTWLPASALRLRDSWADVPPQLRVGEPVSRTIMVEAEGLSSAQIPALALPAPAGLRVYPEPPQQTTRVDGGRLVGISRQTLTYIPNAAGGLAVPGVTVDWWDTTTDQPARAELPAWNLQVAVGSGGQRLVDPPPVATSPPAAGANGNASSDDAADAGSSPDGGGYWYWPAIGLGLLVAAVGVWWLRRRAPEVMAKATAIIAAVARPSAQKSKAKPKPLSRPVAAEKSASMQALEAACRRNDAPAASRALLALAARTWPDVPPRNLADLASRLRDGAAEVRALDQHLYGADASIWPADALWTAVRHGLTVRAPQASGDTTDVLPPLYPHRL